MNIRYLDLRMATWGTTLVQQQSLQSLRTHYLLTAKDLVRSGAASRGLGANHMRSVWSMSSGKGLDRPQYPTPLLSMGSLTGKPVCLWRYRVWSVGCLHGRPVAEASIPLGAARVLITDYRFPIPDYRFPIPDSRFLIPDS